MLTAPARDWNVFKQIFADHWDAFRQAHARYQTPYYDELVAKMLACGNPKRMGYVEYRCLHCGQGQHVVSMSCKSSLCLRCAIVYADTWVSQVSKALHEGIIYRHIILTVPALLRTAFYHNAGVLLRALMRCGAQCLDDVLRVVRGTAVQGGSIVVLHTHGRNGQYHPHLHLLAPSGGWEPQSQRWAHVAYLPYALLRRKWQWHVLTMVRQTLKSTAVQQVVDTCWRTYPNGLVPNVQKGTVPAQFQSVARYVAKYVVSPPMAVRRIDRYDGERVTYHYRSHRTDRVAHETVDVHTFIGRMVQHALPKGFTRMRYDGVQATQTFATVKELIHQALTQVQGVVKGAVKILARLTSRQRYEQSTGCDPLRCPHCGEEMAVWRIWQPTYGVVSDEGQKIKRGTYTSSAQRAGP
jgi:Putative transposase/Transposase zinc-binding domain